MFGKPYITFKSFIVSMVGIILCIISTIMALIFVEKDNMDLVALPVVLLITCIGMALCVILIPVKLWSIPFRPKEGRENAVYADCFFMVAVIIALTGVYSLVSVIIACVASQISIIASMIYALLSLLAVIVIMIKSYKENKR